MSVSASHNSSQNRDRSLGLWQDNYEMCNAKYNKHQPIGLGSGHVGSTPWNSWLKFKMLPHIPLQYVTDKSRRAVPKLYSWMDNP
jgi:hypothetical protein